MSKLIFSPEADHVSAGLVGPSSAESATQTPVQAALAGTVLPFTGLPCLRRIPAIALSTFPDHFDRFRRVLSVPNGGGRSASSPETDDEAIVFRLFRRTGWSICSSSDPEAIARRRAPMIAKIVLQQLSEGICEQHSTEASGVARWSSN